jgi:hypothetical protein
MSPPPDLAGWLDLSPPRQPPRWRRVVWAGSGVVGAAVSLGLTAVAAVLMAAYVVSFTATATPDSGFNVFTIPAALCVLAAVLLAPVALVMLFFRPTRPAAIGYLSGLVLGVAGIALLFVFL